MDLSKLSDTDLEAITKGDLSKVSDEGLSYLSAGQPTAPKASVGRQLALTGRNLLQGGVNAVAGPYDALIGSINYAGGKLNDAFGLTESNYPTISGSLDQSLNTMGVPRPATQGEQTAARYVQTGAGLATGLGIGNILKSGTSAIGSEIGRQLAARPVLQSVSALTGATASDIAQQSGAGQTGQLIAGLTGALAPGIGLAGTSAALRAAVRGGNSGAEQMSSNVSAAENAGTTLTLGQASGNRGIQAIEQGLGHIKGAQGILEAKAEQQVKDIGARMEQVANRNDALASPAKAGEAVQSGIFGKDTGWLDRSREIMGKLYGKLDTIFAPSTRVGVSNTKAMLADLNAPVAGAESLSANQFTNANIKGIEGAISKDTEGVTAALQNPNRPANILDIINPRNTPRETGILSKTVEFTQAERDKIVNGLVDGKLPMEAVKKLRTAVGEQLDDPNLSAQVKANKYKPLYEALTKDMDAGYGTNPKAQQAWKDANVYTSDRHNVVDLINRSVSKDVPEQIYTALVSGAKNGDTVLKTVLDRIPAEGRQIFADTVLKRLGRTASGESIADAGTFDTAAFQKNWGALSPETKQTLFGSVSSNMRQYLKSVDKTIDRISAGKDVSAAHIPASSFKDALRTGASLTGVPYGLAKLATSATATKWAAAPTKIQMAPAAWIANANRSGFP